MNHENLESNLFFFFISNVLTAQNFASHPVVKPETIYSSFFLSFPVSSKTMVPNSRDVDWY